MSQEQAWVSVEEDGSSIDVIVVTGLSRSRVMGIQEGKLLIHLDCIEEEANHALLQFLAARLAVSSVQMEVLDGSSNAKKRVCISKVPKNKVLLALSPRG